MDKLSSKHLILLIIAVSIISLRSFSSIFISIGGRDTWFLALIASLIMTFFIWIIFKHIIKTSYFDMCRDNIILKAISVISLFLLCIESATTEAASIHNNYFLNTPSWFCLLFFIISATYVACKSFNSVLITTIVLVIINLIGDIIILILASKYLDLNNLLPIFSSTSTKDKFMCTISILGGLSSIIIIMPYLRLLAHKRSLLSDCILSLLIVGVIITTSFATMIAFLGSTRGGYIFFPEYIEFQRIKIADFIEFGELFFIFRSVCMYFTKYILCLYGLKLILKKTESKNTLFVTLISIAVFIISNYLSNNTYTLFNFLQLLMYSLCAMFLIFFIVTITTNHNK